MEFYILTNALIPNLVNCFSFFSCFLGMISCCLSWDKFLCIFILLTFVFWNYLPQLTLAVLEWCLSVGTGMYSWCVPSGFTGRARSGVITIHDFLWGVLFATIFLGGMEGLGLSHVWDMVSSLFRARRKWHPTPVLLPGKFHWVTKTQMCLSTAHTHAHTYNTLR